MPHVRRQPGRLQRVPVPTGTGPTTLTHSLGGPDGHILPNTQCASAGGSADGTTRIGRRFEPSSPTIGSTGRPRGDVVRVHWYDGDQAFGERALQIGQREVEETAKLLGVSETEAVDFFIYADRVPSTTPSGRGPARNVGGQANSEIRTLFADIAPSSIDDPWVENVVPHELIHLVFDTAVQNPYRPPPRWLNEVSPSISASATTLVTRRPWRMRSICRRSDSARRAGRPVSDGFRVRAGVFGGCERGRLPRARAWPGGACVARQVVCRRQGR